MKVLILTNTLGIGGTEKAACFWACGLKERGHEIAAISVRDGPRKASYEANKIPVKITGKDPVVLAEALREINPEVIHIHAPGVPHEADVLGDALKLLPKKIPVVQTNVFGRLKNPSEDQWTDFRLFISWTSCVQAARRSFLRLDADFFRRASVAVYPLSPSEPTAADAVAAFRQKIGVSNDEILFGKFARPDHHKWTDLVLKAFRLALRRSSKLKLLFREPPPEVAAQLRAAPDARHFIILPATADEEELRLTMSAVDAVLHTAKGGESFGYGIAEPMNLGKAVITNSVPWADQAQLELIRNGECGFLASIPQTMAAAIIKLSQDNLLRQKMGEQGRRHIRLLAEPNASIARLEAVLQATIEHRDNPFAESDRERALSAAEYLDQNEFGYSFFERIALRPLYYKARFHQLRTTLKFKFRAR